MARVLVFAGLACTLSGCAATRGTIGAVLAQGSERQLLVREVPPGLAAAQAGVQEGDEVLLIDGRDVRAMSSEQVHRALEGDPGEPVKLTLVRGDAALRVTLRRTPARRHRPPTMPGSSTGAPAAGTAPETATSRE